MTPANQPCGTPPCEPCNYVYVGHPNTPECGLRRIAHERIEMHDFKTQKPCPVHSEQPASGEAAMPPEAWLAEKAGYRLRFGRFDGIPTGPGKWVYLNGMSWMGVPIAPYSDAGRTTITDWLVKAGNNVLFGPDGVCVFPHHDWLSAVFIRNTDPKAALAAAVAKLREGA